MKKLALIFLLFIIHYSLFITENVSAYSTPVQDVFSDIDSNYKYLNELQKLYDKGMIIPDKDGKFNPRALLKRDEFVGILSEVTCKKCIQPFVSYDLIEKYENKSIFFDINKKNKYFYCVADSENNLSVNGYDVSTTCDDGTFKKGEKPFCSNNNIILEEALSIILRVSGILTYDEAVKIRKDISDGKITQVLSDDVSPKNLDGSVYSFYPDFQRALDYELVEIDTKGNSKTYKLIDVIDGKIRPKQTISKEDFLKMAFVVLKANSCIDKQENTLSVNIIIKDSKCKSNNDRCKLTNLNQTNSTYDFTENVGNVCKGGIKEPGGYIRRFYNFDTGEEIKKYGKYIDNYEFLTGGDWKIFLRVTDSCGNTGEVYNSIYVDDKENNKESSSSGGLVNNKTANLSVISSATPIYGEGPLSVDFNTVVSGGGLSYTYYREFGDGNTGNKKNEKNIYKHEGIYQVILHVIGENGKKGSASLIIKVVGMSDSVIDTDGDGIIDINDLCPLVVGNKDNKGCPILVDKCNEIKVCKNGTYCSEKNICEPNILSNSCEYKGGDVIFGNILCNSCPCDYSLDFVSRLRKCDIIFPAITSPDNKKVYSRGGFYQIK